MLYRHPFALSILVTGTMLHACIMIIAGALVLALRAEGLSTISGSISCFAEEDCPKCSRCLMESEDPETRASGICVFDNSPEENAKCKQPKNACQERQCSSVGKCQKKTTNRPNYPAMVCDKDKVCLDGECGWSSYHVKETTLQGLNGQNVNLKGEDGGWYALIADNTIDLQLSVRLSSPPPYTTSSQDRHITGVAIKYEGDHSIVIENKHPDTTATEGCPEDWFVPCLSENSLSVSVDEQEHLPEPVEQFPLPGDRAFLTAINLPPECMPYGGDQLWADTFADMMAAGRQQSRRLGVISGPDRRTYDSGADRIYDWFSGWLASTAAPEWCKKFVKDAGLEGTLAYHGTHSVFRVETPSFVLRLHNGVNVDPLGEEYWQMAMHLERYDLDMSTVTGLLGETARPVRNSDGLPIMSGDWVVRGDVEDYRISGPLASDFKFYHA